MNRVIIRDANLLFALNEFFEKFVNCVIVSLIDLFVEYDQLFLVQKCKNMIVFIISFDLVKISTIFLKAIYSMTQFVRVVNKIIVDHVSHYAFLFVNDIKVKKLKIKYNNEFIFFEIRSYVIKHI